MMPFCILVHQMTAAISTPGLFLHKHIQVLNLTMLAVINSKNNRILLYKLQQVWSANYSPVR